jgi:hypothetical protein
MKVIILWESWQGYDDQFERRSSLFWATRWALTEAVIFLIDEQGMEITEHVIWVAVTFKGGGVPALKFLLDRTEMKITQSIVETVAGN